MVANEAVMGNWRLHHWKGNCPYLGLKVILGMSTYLVAPAMLPLNSLLLIVVSKIILVPLHRHSLVLLLRVRSVCPFICVVMIENRLISRLKE